MDQQQTILDFKKEQILYFKQLPMAYSTTWHAKRIHTDRASHALSVLQIIKCYLLDK